MASKTESLAETLRLRRVEGLRSDATLIRDHPDGPERLDLAQQMVRQAMVDQALGKLTVAERTEILDILSFAVETLRVQVDQSDGHEPPTTMSPAVASVVHSQQSMGQRVGD